VRRSFPEIAASGFLAWAVLGVFSAIIASLIGTILRTGNLAVTAGALTLMISTSAAAQLAAPRLRPPTGQWVGLSTLAAGLSLLVVAAATSSVAFAVLAMIGSGIGHGLVFAGSLSEITVATPARERGAVLGLVYFINYLGLGFPVIVVGVLSRAARAGQGYQHSVRRDRGAMPAAHPVGIQSPKGLRRYDQEPQPGRAIYGLSG
jgi:hypothetical protein